MRTFLGFLRRFWAVALLLPILILARHRPAPRPIAARPPAAPPRPTPTPPDAGNTVDGFWHTWERPLRKCLTEHQGQEGGRGRHRFALTVEKSRNRMVLTCDGEPAKGYFVAVGRQPSGAKERRGDRRTPEGDYYVWGRNANSRFHRALGVSYPNASDAEEGLHRGLIDKSQFEKICHSVKEGGKPPQGTALGGDIMLHGGGIGKVVVENAEKRVVVKNWTAGCIALRNEDIDELFAVLPPGTPLHIEP